jgi:plasmid stabilization system protein ParE
LTDRALRDVQAIYDRIRAEPSAQAHSWFNHLVHAIYSLERYPDRGTTTPESKTLRQLHHGAKPDTYRIIYKVNKRARVVDILHIRHGARAPFRPE